MLITVGSKNQVKINAVREILNDYPVFANAEVMGVDAKSEVSDQPFSLQEAITGAKNRAKNAFKDCYLSVGIEAGLMHAPDTESEFWNVTFVAIYDGERFHIAKSSGFAIPPTVIRLMKEKNLELDKAFHAAGLSDNSDLGSTHGGIIGILTKGRMSRTSFIQEALRMALIPFEQSHLYGKTN